MPNQKYWIMNLIRYKGKVKLHNLRFKFDRRVGGHAQNSDFCLGEKQPISMGV